MAPAKVIVTRPARETARWVADLRAAGLDAVALPLIAVEPLDDRSGIRAAWQQLGNAHALMFVSAAAVEHFFAEAGGHAAADRDLRYWATGPGTTRALREAGVPAASIDAPAADADQFDSESLWALVRSQVHPGMRVLIIRGGDAAGNATGRDWLAREIVSAGGHCDAVVAYRRMSPALADAERRVAIDGASGTAIFLFSSSEAIGNLCRWLPDTKWRSARVVATHERIAQAARAAGFGSVRVSQPSLPALVASIESFA